MRFFLINLDRDADRLAHMQAQMDALGLSLTRVPACYGLAMPDRFKPFFLNADGAIASAMNKGEVGCYASHLQVMQKIIDDNITEPVCVMEDDLRFAPGFHKLISIVDQLPADWDIVRLSNPSKSAYQVIKTLPGAGAIIRYWRVPNNTGAYLINQRGAQKCLDHRTLRLRPVDEDLRRPWEHGMVTYGITPPPVVSNIFDSTIDAIGSDRSLPARKRFRDAHENRAAEWSYRVTQFGIAGSLEMMFKTVMFKKRIRTEQQKLDNFDKNQAGQSDE